MEQENARNYPRRLGQWVRKKGARPPDEHMVAFLAVREEVAAALEAGFALKTIWANQRERRRIAFCYQTFCNYVKRFIRPGAMPRQRGMPGQTAMAHRTTAPRPAERAGAVQSADPPGIREVAIKSAAQAAADGFKFNPFPKKEDYL